MAWIETHEELWEHHKVVRLCTALNQPDYAVVGRLIGLWHFVLRNAWKDANLEPWGDDGIEKASRWDGEKGVWTRALRECGFLDGYVVHGWQERAGRLVQDRRRNERRKQRRLTGGKAAVKRTKNRANPVTPNHTIPNHTQPNPTLPEESPAPIAPKPPHVQFVDAFKASYESVTQKPFKADKSDFIIAQKLITKYTYPEVVEKTKVLGVMCRDQSAWFTKEGWAAFSIKKLSAMWNEILETRIQDPDHKKREEFRTELEKVRRHRERVNQAINGR